MNSAAGEGGGSSDTFGSDTLRAAHPAPRSSAPDAGRAPEPWQSRPVAAFVVRAVAFVAPFALAVAAAWAVSELLPVPHSWEWAIARVVLIVAVTVAMVIIAKRAVRRLGPLSALLRLSAAFPHDAPNRFRMAMQMPSARHLERALNGEPVDHRILAAADGNVAARIVALMTAISAHHPRTRGHSERVRAYADLIGEEMGLDETDRERLRWSALLHDVGKLDVPVDILDKPRQPDSTEWHVLEAHPAASAVLTEPLEPWLGPWWGGIGEHHERWDGTGYPDGLRGNEISLAGRIVGVADSFETMTELRSYKQPMSFAAAQQELVDSAGTHFDPAVVRAFLGISTSRVRRAAGWAAWIPGPLVEAFHLGGTAAAAIAGPAGVATTAAVSLIVPGLADDVFRAPIDQERQVVIASDRASDPDDVDAPIDVVEATPAPTLVVTTPSPDEPPADTEPPAATAPTGTPSPDTAPTATTGPATDATSSPATVTTTTTASRPATPAPPPTPAPTVPPTTLLSPGTSPPTTPAPTAPPTTVVTATTVAPSTTIAPTTTALTPPPRWVGTPTFNVQGLTIFASGIEVEGWGLPAFCRLWLDVPGFVATELPCRTFTSVLAPAPATTYTVRIQARTDAGETEVIEGRVTTGP